MNVAQLVKYAHDKTTDYEHLKKNIFYNRNHIFPAYMTMYQERNDNKYKIKATAVYDCLSNWLTTKAFNTINGKMNVRILERTNRCKDYKFCNNCKKMHQLAMLHKFLPKIQEELQKGNHAYHVVFTVRNVSGDALRDTLTTMEKAFTKLTHALKRKSMKSSAIFDEFNYLGIIRNLEITTNDYSSGTSYHPHYHVLLLSDKPLNLNKYIVNSFSFKDSDLRGVYFDEKRSMRKKKFTKSQLRAMSEAFAERRIHAPDMRSENHKYIDDFIEGEINKYNLTGRSLVRPFSKIEIFLQRYWKALYITTAVKNDKQNILNDEDLSQLNPKDIDPDIAMKQYDAKGRVKKKIKTSVTKKDIIQMLGSNTLGYSVTIDEFTESGFIESFKYMTKGTTQGNKEIDASSLSQEQFEVLYDSTLDKKMIKTYGVFRGMDKAVKSTADSLSEDVYSEIIDTIIKTAKAIKTEHEKISEIVEDKKFINITRNKIGSVVNEDLLKNQSADKAM